MLPPFCKVLFSNEEVECDLVPGVLFSKFRRENSDLAKNTPSELNLLPVTSLSKTTN